LRFEQENSNGGMVAHIVEMGRQQGYLTYDEILEVLPEVERDLDFLEKIFAALISAGISVYDGLDSQDSKGRKGSSDENVDQEDDLVDEGQAVYFDDHLDYIDTSDLVGLYFKDAASYPLLTFQEEVELAKRIERGQQARLVLTAGEPLSIQSQQQIKAQVDDGWAAVENLLNANSRLVISIAKRYLGRGVAFLDLIQEGNIGLMRAVKKFDYHRGYKFSTYATWWIRQAVTRALADQGRTIRLPVHISDRLRKLFRVQHELRQDLGREPRVDEIGEAMELSPGQVQFMLRVAQQPISLETPTTFEDDAVLGDFIEDEKSPDPDESATQSLLRQQLEQTFDDELPSREARILKLRFGLSGGKKHTLSETGEKMGVTRERIRQIEAQALSRLRKPHIFRKLRAYLGPLKS